MVTRSPLHSDSAEMSDSPSHAVRSCPAGPLYPTPSKLPRRWTHGSMDKETSPTPFPVSLLLPSGAPKGCLFPLWQLSRGLRTAPLCPSGPLSPALSSCMPARRLAPHHVLISLGPLQRPGRVLGSLGSSAVLFLTSGGVAQLLRAEIMVRRKLSFPGGACFSAAAKPPPEGALPQVKV